MWILGIWTLVLTLNTSIQSSHQPPDYIFKCNSIYIKLDINLTSNLNKLFYLPLKCIVCFSIHRGKLRAQFIPCPAVPKTKVCDKLTALSSYHIWWAEFPESWSECFKESRPGSVSLAQPGSCCPNTGCEWDSCRVFFSEPCVLTPALLLYEFCVCSLHRSHLVWAGDMPELRAAFVLKCDWISHVV